MTPLLPLWGAAALFMVLVMTAAWVVQRRTLQGGWADAFWSLGLGAAGVGVALTPVDGVSPSARQWLTAALIGLWGLRLGLHIAARAARESEDARYARLRQEWGPRFQSRMFGFLMLQAGAGALLVLGILLAARNPAPGLGLQDGLAAIIFMLALLGEAMADRQLTASRPITPTAAKSVTRASGHGRATLTTSSSGLGGALGQCSPSTSTALGPGVGWR